MLNYASGKKTKLAIFACKLAIFVRKSYLIAAAISHSHMVNDIDYISWVAGAPLGNPQTGAQFSGKVFAGWVHCSNISKLTGAPGAPMLTNILVQYIRS